MLSADPSPPYDRPNLSKDYLAGTAQADWIPLRPLEFYAEQGIDLRVNTRVMAIDAAAHRVTLGRQHGLYGALLLATGAEPIRLEVPGGTLPHVHVLRTSPTARAPSTCCDGATMRGGRCQLHRA